MSNCIDEGKEILQWEKSEMLKYLENKNNADSQGNKGHVNSKNELLVVQHSVKSNDELGGLNSEDQDKAFVEEFNSSICTLEIEKEALELENKIVQYSVEGEEVILGVEKESSILDNVDRLSNISYDNIYIFLQCGLSIIKDWKGEKDIVHKIINNNIIPNNEMLKKIGYQNWYNVLISMFDNSLDIGKNIRHKLNNKFCIDQQPLYLLERGIIFFVCGFVSGIGGEVNEWLSLGSWRNCEFLMYKSNLCTSFGFNLKLQMPSFMKYISLEATMIHIVGIHFIPLLLGVFTATFLCKFNAGYEEDIFCRFQDNVGVCLGSFVKGFNYCYIYSMQLRPMMWIIARRLLFDTVQFISLSIPVHKYCSININLGNLALQGILYRIFDEDEDNY